MLIKYTCRHAHKRLWKLETGPCVCCVCYEGDGVMLERLSLSMTSLMFQQARSSAEERERCQFSASFTGIAHAAAAPCPGHSLMFIHVVMDAGIAQIGWHMSSCSSKER